MSTAPYMTELTAISPADGRYAAQLGALREICSEYGLMRYRVRVELAWVLHLASEKELDGLVELDRRGRDTIRRLAASFDPTHAQRIKDIEATTNHDVKAVEYFIRERLLSAGIEPAVAEFVHFACTSEDINNLAYALMLQEARDEVLDPALREIEQTLLHSAGEFADLAMLSRTHGQPASPTTLGKELANFARRLRRERQTLSRIPVLGKFNGAVGNYNAHYVAVPDADWPGIASRFISGLGLSVNPYTTQIEPHDWIAEYCHALERCNTVLLGLCRDIWSYISIGYFRQRSAAHETGSSTMPHKVNPIDFENAEGNFGIANALLSHFAAKLPVSRWQRDLSDSTVLRNLGVALAHSLLAYTALQRGHAKLEPDAQRLDADLAGRWELLAEPIQTVMRRYGLSGGYEELKSLTRGKTVTREAMQSFIRNLDLPQEIRDRLLQLEPATYLGNAAAAARAADRDD